MRVKHHSELELIFKENQNLTEIIKELTRCFIIIYSKNYYFCNLFKQVYIRQINQINKIKSWKYWWYHNIFNNSYSKDIQWSVICLSTCTSFSFFKTVRCCELSTRTFRETRKQQRQKINQQLSKFIVKHKIWKLIPYTMFKWFFTHFRFWNAVIHSIL